MIESMDEKWEHLVKWLRILMYAAIVSFANSLLNYLPLIPAAVTTWVSRGVMLAKVVCFLQLGSVSDCYRRVGILRAVLFAITLVTTFLYGSTILALVTVILSLVATYQEYHAHGEAAEEKDARLAARWRGLFGWSLAASLLLSVGSSIITMILVGQDVPAGRISSITNAVLKIPGYVIDVIYILSIRRMIMPEDPV